MKIIKFTAVWCADCIVMRPMWSEVVNKYPNLKIEEFDFDDHIEEVKKHQIKKVPHTIIADDDGEVLYAIEGLKSKQELLRLIEEYLNLQND